MNTFRKSIAIIFILALYVTTTVAQAQGQAGTAQFHNLELSADIEGGQLTYQLNNNSKRNLQVQYEIWDIQDWVKNNNAPRPKHTYALFQLKTRPTPRPIVRLFKGIIRPNNVWWATKAAQGGGAIHQENVWMRILNNNMEDKPLHTGIIKLSSSATVPIHLQESLRSEATYVLVLRVKKK